MFGAAAIVVYVLVAGLIVYAALRYRRRAAGPARGARFSDNTPLEIAWTIVPLLVVAGLFAVSNAAEFHVERVSKPADEVVDVVGFRWSWRFLYPGQRVMIQGTSAQPPELVLPLGRTTEIRLSSSDVIHAFWIPAFLFKRDAIPGHVSAFDLNPTRAGVFAGHCAEYCGTYHELMTFTVRVLPPGAYAAWLRAHAGTT